MGHPFGGPVMKFPTLSLVTGIVFAVLTVYSAVSMVNMLPWSVGGHEIPMLVHLPVALVFGLIASLLIKNVYDFYQR